MSRNILVIIPARNEEATVGRVVRFVLDRGDADVVVIDDDGSDGTSRVAAESGAVVLTAPFQLGAWGAIQAGVRYAVRNEYEIVVTMDADGQHMADYIDDLLHPLHAQQADVVIGSCVRRGSPARRFAWSLFRSMTGISLRDLTSGFRSYNVKAMRVLASPGATLLDYQDIGVLLLLMKKGLRIGERDVSMCERKVGHSRIFSNWGEVAKYMMAGLVLSLSKSTRAESFKRFLGIGL